MMLKKLTDYFLQRNNIFIFLVILTGSIVWSLTMVRSGLKYPFGIGFWGANGHDAVWHISLIESLSRGSFGLPIYSGEMIKNYHIGFDLLVAFVHRVTLIPVSILYFQVLPVVFSLTLGFLVYKLVIGWTKSQLAVFWSLFFVYFGGGVGYIVNFLREDRLGGDSMFWAQSAATTLINPPFALSLVIICMTMLVLSKYEKVHKKHLLIFAIVLLSVLIQIKVYAGILALVGIFFVGIYEMIIKKNYVYFIIFLISSLTSLLLILPFVDFGKSSLVFYPLWYLETLMLYQDRFHWEKFYNAMTSYRYSGDWIKFLLFYAISFVIFMIGNLGLRIVGFLNIFTSIKKIKSLRPLEIFGWSIVIFGVIFPMIFIQRGTPWNTIQFYYYSLFFLGIFSGIWIGKFMSNGENYVFKGCVSLLVILFTLPVSISTLGHYMGKLPQSAISTDELNALDFLEQQPEGVVLSMQLKEELSLDFIARKNPRQIYLYESTSYISAYTKKDVYFEDEVNLNIMGYDWPERKDKSLAFIKNSNSLDGYNFLRKNSISYIYQVKRVGVGLDEKILNLDNIYDNDEIIIYRVI